MNGKRTSGTYSLFLFRNWGQNSQQATVERAGRGERPLPIPRTGTAAPIGTSTVARVVKKG